MAVHLPISDEAQREARDLIAADKNILKPGSGDPTITHSQDMVLGIYYLTDYYNTKYPENRTEEERLKLNPVVGIFNTIDDVLDMYHNGNVQVKDKIILNYNGTPITTMVGRVIFNNVLPERIRFMNIKQKSKDLKKILSRIFDEYDMQTTVVVADAIKDLGFKYSTIAATSINVLDMMVPATKEEELRQGDDRTNEIYKYYYKGFFSEDEKHRNIVKIRTEVKSNVEKSLKDITGPGQDLYTMIDSGARGSQTHMTQISGMKGLVVNPKGEIIELPIKNSYVE
jgi:DNA-directed RNA polymerase subunit beta'